MINSFIGSILNKKSILIEAPTGIGKTLGLLACAILWNEY
jgi:Rad3-related DNA helicase